MIIGFLFRHNIMAVIFGSWIISNPVTDPSPYIPQYELGHILVDIALYEISITDYALKDIDAMGLQTLTLPFLAGGVITAPRFAMLAYFISRRLSMVSRAKRSS
jgi:uncharacterized protein (DUF2062 family)